MSEPTPLLVYGNGRQAEQLLAELDGDARYRVLAVTADAEFVRGDTFGGRLLLPFEEAVERFPPGRCAMMVAIGYRRMRDRGRMFERARAVGYSLPSYIAAGAHVYRDLELGAGCQVFDLVYLGPRVKLGAGVVIRPHTYLGHDGVVEDRVFLAPSVAIGGRCRIGEASFIGLGARIVDGISVGAESLIGAGAVVVADTEPSGVYLGHPAVRVREHPETGVILES